MEPACVVIGTPWQLFRERDLWRNEFESVRILVAAANTYLSTYVFILHYRFVYKKKYQDALIRLQLRWIWLFL